MSLDSLHERCAMVQQTLIDLIAAVLDLQQSQEMEHLQAVLEAAMRAVQEDVPPVSEVDTAETNG